jgi:hypothetical protein
LHFLFTLCWVTELLHWLKLNVKEHNPRKKITLRSKDMIKNLIIVKVNIPNLNPNI